MDCVAPSVAPFDSFLGEAKSSYRPSDNSSLADLFSKNNFLCKPIINLKFANGHFKFQPRDLERVFNRIGGTWKLSLSEDGKSAVVAMGCFRDAFKAVDTLGDRKIEHQGKSDYIRASFLPSDDGSKSYLDILSKSVSFESILNSRKDSIKSEQTTPSAVNQPSSKTTQSQNSTSVAKVTCKYEIVPFDEDAARDFLLSKRIIGPKGSNMKKIIEECFGKNKIELDVLKLRLRGKGSGFKEGPNNQGKVV